MRTSRTVFLTLFFVLGMLASANAQTASKATAEHTALPYPTAETPNAIDAGILSRTMPLSITIALRLRDLNEAEELLTSLHTPGNAQCHKFLTAAQFVARFAPTDADVAKVTAGLAKYGLTAQRTTATTLKVTGQPADIEHAFSVSLHSYEVPAHDKVPSFTFYAPLAHSTIPAEIAPYVAAVVGLDGRPSFRPNSRTVPESVTVAPSANPLTATPDAPGLWTVIDFADYYDVQPLYRAGLSGSGRTIGIVTLASFTPSDAFAYWSAIGLNVNPKRISIVNVDGGPGAPSDASGSTETALDVEQSGGVAPGANMIVYQAPNTGQAFLDAFAAAVDANAAETVSTSWALWEWAANLENDPVTDPSTGQTVGFAQATHEILLRAAIQGQTFFVAAGDGGAYAATWYFDCYGPYSPAQPNSCSQPLSVFYPGSDPAITAAGGTTLAGVQELCLNAACTPPYYAVDVPHERVWGWDYLIAFCNALGEDPISCGIFPWGSSGGVSVMFGEPSYQFSLPGIQLSQPGQIWEAGEAVGSENDVGTYYALPAFYQGRNIPDISFNADPDTGYVIYYTSNVTGFGILKYWGGTSFVAPQLNGVSALLGQYLHGRIGLLNYPLYEIVHNGQAYGGSVPAFHAIPYGDNWFYYGSDGYNLGVGFGTLDVANFAQILADQF